jgi:hypothetical protein
MQWVVVRVIILEHPFFCREQQLLHSHCKTIISLNDFLLIMPIAVSGKNKAAIIEFRKVFSSPAVLRGSSSCTSFIIQSPKNSLSFVPTYKELPVCLSLKCCFALYDVSATIAHPSMDRNPLPLDMRVSCPLLPTLSVGPKLSTKRHHRRILDRQ